MTTTTMVAESTCPCSWESLSFRSFRTQRESKKEKKKKRGTNTRGNVRDRIFRAICMPWRYTASPILRGLKEQRTPINPAFTSRIEKHSINARRCALTYGTLREFFFSRTFEPGRLSLEFFLRNVRAEVLEKKKKSPIAIIPNSSIVDWKREWKGIRVVPGINTMAFICILRRKHERHEKGTEIWKIFTAVTSLCIFRPQLALFKFTDVRKELLLSPPSVRFHAESIFHLPDTDARDENWIYF